VLLYQVFEVTLFGTFYLPHPLELYPVLIQVLIG